MTSMTTSLVTRFTLSFSLLVMSSLNFTDISFNHLEVSLAEVNAEDLELTPTSLTLPQLTGCARQRNPALDIARAELEKMKSTLMGAQGRMLPSLAVDSLFAPLPARRLLKYCVSPTELSGEGLERIIPCPNQDIQDDARLGDVDGMGIYSRTTATLTQPLYTFGKISAGIRAAKAGVRVHEALSEAASYQADELAFQTYYGLILARRAQRTFRKAKRKLAKRRADIERELKAESGKHTSNDLRQLVIKESEIVTLAESVSAQERRALRGVRLSCNISETQEIKPDARKLKPLPVTLSGEEVYLKLALDARPELRAARAQIEARRAQHSLVISQLFPDLALVGTFAFARGTSAEDNPDPFANDPFNVFGYGAYLGLRWRLDLGQIAPRLKRAEVAVARAEADLKALSLQVSLEVSERYQEAVRYQRTLEARKLAMVSGKQWMTSAFLNTSAGLIDSTQLLAALTAYLTTSLNYDRDIYEYNLALMRLWASSGRDPLTLLDDPHTSPTPKASESPSP